jgi:hypothetical protein
VRKNSGFNCCKQDDRGIAESRSQRMPLILTDEDDGSITSELIALTRRWARGDRRATVVGCKLPVLSADKKGDGSK